LQGINFARRLGSSALPKHFFLLNEMPLNNQDYYSFFDERNTECLKLILKRDNVASHNEILYARLTGVHRNPALHLGKHVKRQC
jgi:hypothetical protein